MKILDLLKDEFEDIKNNLLLIIYAWGWDSILFSTGAFLFSTTPILFSIGPILFSRVPILFSTESIVFLTAILLMLKVTIRSIESQIGIAEIKFIMAGKYVRVLKNSNNMLAVLICLIRFLIIIAFKQL